MGLNYITLKVNMYERRRKKFNRWGWANIKECLLNEKKEKNQSRCLMIYCWSGSTDQSGSVSIFDPGPRQQADLMHKCSQSLKLKIRQVKFGSTCGKGQGGPLTFPLPLIRTGLAFPRPASLNAWDNALAFYYLKPTCSIKIHWGESRNWMFVCPHRLS